jgi:hypothetical protein
MELVMHRLLGLATAILIAGFEFFTVTPAQALPICPNTANTNTDCGFIITQTPTNTLTGTLVTGANPYDGSDDALVGVINNGTAPILSFVLTGSGNGGGIFAFDGDGICTFIACTFPNPTGYEGPGISFSHINAAGTSGEVDFAGLGLLPGATAFFSLEGSPNSLNVGGVTPVGVPEPGTLALFLSAMLGFMALARRRLRQDDDR